jgi:hypothetical protein
LWKRPLGSKSRQLPSFPTGRQPDLSTLKGNEG